MARRHIAPLAKGQQIDITFRHIKLNDKISRMELLAAVNYNVQETRYSTRTFAIAEIVERAAGINDQYSASHRAGEVERQACHGPRCARTGGRSSHQDDLLLFVTDD